MGMADFLLALHTTFGREEVQRPHEHEMKYCSTANAHTNAID